MIHYRRAGFWLLLVVLTTLPFWFTRLDLVVTGWFYQSACGKWWLDCYPVFHYLFYDSVPIISVAILLVCLGVIIWTSWQRRHLRLRLHATYFLLVFVLGSGILVNAVFKDHWGRPRPTQVEDFGGKQAYAPPGQYVAGSGGRSFPSGHSSVGFAFIGLWFLWRRKRPGPACLVLWGTLLFGAAVGLTRMAAGGHFLSDVIWSCWVMVFAAWVLYYPVLRIPEREERILKSENHPESEGV